MKAAWLVLIIPLLFTPARAATPQPLKVGLTSYSFLFRPASFKVFSLTYLNQVSSQGDFAPADGEFASAPLEVPTSHYGTFLYTDGQTFETFPLYFEVDAPYGDTNDDGIPDIVQYEPGTPTTGRIEGAYLAPDNSVGTFWAVWTKPANSHVGTCRIIFDFTDPQSFLHTFEIFDYKGTLASVEKNGATLTGQTTLTRDGVTGDTLSGPLSFSLATPGRVSLTSSSLRTETGDLFEWTNPEELERDRHDFYQFFEVLDGTPPDAPANFHDWLFVLTDLNDYDGDGLADLIDPPPTATAPSMRIIRTPEGIRLSITGDVGQTYTLERAASLPAAQWQNPTAVTLTSNPHVLDLPAPTGPTFWRMRYP